MFKNNSVKVLGLIGVGLSAVAMLISRYANDKKMEELIDEKIEERFTDIDDEEEEL